jgi:hypothetical protein
LVKHNHNWGDIQGYTLSELGVFVREAIKQADAAWKQDVLASWLGFNADGEGLKSIIGLNVKGTSSKSTPNAAPGETTKEWKRLANAFSKLR